MDNEENKTVTLTEEKPVAKKQIKRWYIVNTYSMRENKVKENILNLLNKDEALKEQVGQILVAEVEEPVIDKETHAQKRDKDGKPMTKMRNLYPGYVFVEMVMNTDSWYKIRNAQDVTGITGSSGGGQQPYPVPDDEMEPILQRMGIIKEDMYSRYEIGDKIRVIKGPLADSEGTIISIDKNNNMLKVSIILFGNPQEHDIPFSDAEKC